MAGITAFVICPWHYSTTVQPVVNRCACIHLANIHFFLTCAYVMAAYTVRTSAVAWCNIVGEPDHVLTTNKVAAMAAPAIIICYPIA